MAAYLDHPVQPRSLEFHGKRWSQRSEGSASIDTDRSVPIPTNGEPPSQDSGFHPGFLSGNVRPIRPKIHADSAEPSSLCRRRSAILAVNPFPFNVCGWRADCIVLWYRCSAKQDADEFRKPRVAVSQ